MTEALMELSSKLNDGAARLRSGSLAAHDALGLIEECASLAAEAAAGGDRAVRAALEPLPNLPGQLPLPAA